jgi:hypothetical protein
MANDIATGATWQINCSARAGGNKRIRRAQSVEVSDGGSVTAVPEVGPGEMVGFMDAPGAHTITLSMRQTKGATPEIDWLYLKTAKEVFSLTRQVIGGPRTQYPECRVSNISPSDNDQGEITYTVEIIALTVKPM